MNTINKVLIGAVALQLVLAIVLHGRDDSAGSGKLQLLVPDFRAADIARIEVIRGGDELTGDVIDTGTRVGVTLTREPDGWMVSSSHDYPADPAKVEAFFEKVAMLQSRGPIADSQARQEQLRVAQTHFVRKVILHRQSGEVLSFYVGRGAGGRNTALRFEGSDAIHAVPGFPPSAASTTALGWIDTTFFEVPEFQVQSFKLDNAAGNFEFERDGQGGWKVLGDGADALAQGKRLYVQGIDNLVRNAALLKMIEPIDPALSLGSPLATMTLRVAESVSGAAEPGQLKEYTLVLGPERNGRYVVRRPDRPGAVEVALGKLDLIVNWNPVIMFLPELPGEPSRPAQPQPPGPHQAPGPHQPPGQHHVPSHPR